MISDQVERERVRNRVSAREFMSDHEGQGEDDALFDPDDDREDRYGQRGVMEEPLRF